MKKFTKKIFKKIKEIPEPEELINKKVLLFFMIIMAFYYNLIFLNYNKSFPNIEKTFKEKTITPLERKIKEMTINHPIQRMTPYISKRDKKVAAFLVGIAKKESNWGKYSPKLNGKDCYNYWGYRGGGDSVTPSGYTCFDSPRQAVSVVGRRIDKLVNDSDLGTPEKMIVWKCGWNCAGHSNQSVSKWISDVDYYYKKFY